jgi:hypothetical protein
LAIPSTLRVLGRPKRLFFLGLLGFEPRTKGL